MCMFIFILVYSNPLLFSNPQKSHPNFSPWQRACFWGVWKKHPRFPSNFQTLKMPMFHVGTTPTLPTRSKKKRGIEWPTQFLGRREPFTMAELERTVAVLQPPENPQPKVTKKMVGKGRLQTFAICLSFVRGCSALIFWRGGERAK